MDANIKILKETDFKTSAWSGGDTTQVYIYPETARYEQQDFLYRISTANVLDETSCFTKLENYNRILTVLEGSIELEQDRKNSSIHLNTMEQCSFGGEIPVISHGRCKDFNVMFKKSLQGQVRMIQLKKSSLELDLEPGTDYVLYVLGGRVSVQLNQNHLLVCCKEALVLNRISGAGHKLKIVRKDENTCMALCCITLND